MTILHEELVEEGSEPILVRVCHHGRSGYSLTISEDEGEGEGIRLWYLTWKHVHDLLKELGKTLKRARKSIKPFKPNPAPPHRLDWPVADKPHGDEVAPYMARVTRADVRRATGYQYQHLERDVARLSRQGADDLRRLIRDMQANVTRAKRRSPWYR